MNICKITNWIGNFIDYTIDSDYVEIEFDSYDLNEVILTIGIGIFFILFISWWRIPLRTITHALHFDRIKFKCNKNR